MDPARLDLEERTVDVPGTRSSGTGLAGWMQEAGSVGAIPRHSAPQYARCKRLYTSLQLRDVHACRDEATLEQFMGHLSRARSWPVRHALCSFVSAAWLGAMRRETYNQLRWVRGGCVVRTKGPRLDPEQIPDDRLDVLIQSHRDMGLVEALRAEKRRRLGELSAIRAAE